MFVRLSPFAVLLAVVPLPLPTAEAAPPSIHRRAVDRLTVALPDGGTAELPGVFAGVSEAAAGAEVGKNPADAVRFAVRRDDVDLDHPGLTGRWEERATTPAAAPPVETPESGDPVAIAEQLQTRLVPWLERRGDDPSLSLFLEQEFERVSDLLADREEGVEPEPSPEPSAEEREEPSVPRATGPWAVLNVPRSAIRDMHRTAPHRRRLALHAWNAGLRNVAYRPADDLREELNRRGLDLRTEPSVGWSDAAPETPLEPEVPFVAQLQSEEEWAARVAIVESSFLPEFSFQGTGSTLMKTPASGEAVNGQAMMMQMAGGQYRDLLDELSQPNAFGRRAQTERRKNRNQTAIAAAEKAGRTGVRVTRVEMDAAAGRTTVRSEFLARLPSGEWVPVWTAQNATDFSDADPQTVARIRDDPQVKGLLGGGGLAGGLGGLLGGGPGGGGLMETALQGGAATKTALDAVNAEWEAFRAPYLNRLDGPPLTDDALTDDAR